MSKNPYFAHLPTWRNRQDLAYAIDSLPTILETLTASSPLLATYSYPSTSSSSFPSSSHSSTFSSPCSSYSSPSANTTSASPCSSSATSYPSPPSSTSSSYATSSASACSLSPAKSKASAFKERIVLDLAKECHRSLSRSPSPSTTTSTSNTPNTSSRRVSASIQPSQHQLQQQQQQPPQQYQDQMNRTGPSPYYPLQFSTRAKAMAYLIEILQSLQKEPCGCDLVKGCYCGQDGIEDHEGKSPCYVCGEWYLDRRESSRNGESGGGYEGDVDGMRGGGSAQRQGKAWHEQGSLRHHVAEAKVKKWLDSVWKPPLTPATTPEQENVRKFGLQRQENLRQCIDHPQHQHQQHHVRMEPGRPWSVHDIEIEARAKSRSRNNSTSSTNSLSFVASPTSSTYYYPPTASVSPLYATSSYSSASPQQDLSGSAYGYASGSGSWHLNTSSASPSSSSKPVQATPPSQRKGPVSLAPQPVPVESRVFSSFGFDNQPQQGYQARVRTMSCSDAPPPSGSKPPFFAGSSSSASLRSSTPPVMRPHSKQTSHINSIHSTSTSTNSNGSCRSKPVRASTANSTFAIPQEILDPNYKSPTFRIKSWNPASSASSTNHSPAASSFTPIASRLAFAKESSSADFKQEKKKQTLDGWTSSPAQSAAVATPLPSSLSSSVQESVLKSSKINRPDQEDRLVFSSPDAGGQQGNTREDLSPISKAFPIPTSTPTPPPTAAESGAGLEAEVEVKKSTPFQLNFTSSRFRAAVQAKASLDNHKSVRRESVQKSAAFPNDNEDEVIHTLPRPIPQLAATEENVKDRKKANILVVEVVIVTEQVVMRDSDKAAVAGRKEHLEPTTTDTLAQFKTTSAQSVSSRTLSIQKSAPLSPSILPTSTNASAASVKTFSSSSSSAASTSTSTSAPANNSTSQLCSREPKSPKKEIEKNASDFHQTTSWSSLQKLMRTVAASATAAGPSSPMATASLVLGQSTSMLHVDASSSLAS